MRKSQNILTLTALFFFILVSSGATAIAQTSNSPASNEPQTEIAPDSNDYVIGPEDVLSIHVWKEDALSSNAVPVRMDGKITVPLIDEILAAGLTPLKLKELLTQKFKEFFDEPLVSVAVVEANSFKVYVSGLIKNPGVVRLKSQTSVLQIISMVGGFTEWPKQRKLIIFRKEGGKDKRIEVSYKKILLGEDLESNILLKPGDTIIVQ